MARIVISEFMDERAVAQLRQLHDVIYDPNLVDDADRLMVSVAACDALIVRNRTQVRGALLDGLRGCRVVGRLGVGLDNIDVSTCESRGIRVIPATGANALSVAEYALTSAMMLLRGAYQSTAAVAAGDWPRAALSQGRETAGKTMGVVGFGSIGRILAGLAQGVGMQVVAHDAMLTPDDAAYTSAGVKGLTLDELVDASDVISLHVPLVASTRGLFNCARIARMRAGSVLINSSRGHIVDMAALVTALRSGHLAGAALDVFDAEPLVADASLQGCPGLLLTPHISGVSSESNERVSFLIADQVIQALA